MGSMGALLWGSMSWVSGDAKDDDKDVDKGENKESADRASISEEDDRLSDE